MTGNAKKRDANMLECVRGYTHGIPLNVVNVEQVYSQGIAMLFLPALKMWFTTPKAMGAREIHCFDFHWKDKEQGNAVNDCVLKRMSFFLSRIRFGQVETL